MSEQWSERARRYFDAHAINPQIAATVGVRERSGALIYPCKPREGDPFERKRPLRGRITYQPEDTPLALWWPLGVPDGTRPDDAAKQVVAFEGEADLLAGLSVLMNKNGDAEARRILLRSDLTFAAIPGTGYPVDRLVDELLAAGTREAYLAFDADESGDRCAVEAAGALREVGVTPLRVPLPEGSDLAECLAAAEDRASWLADALLTADAMAEAEEAGKEVEPEEFPALTDVLDAAEAFIRRFVVLGRHELVALVLWIAHTHAFAGAHCTPYLALSSAAKRAGKTRAFEVIEPLVRKPWRALAASEAALFRKLDRDGPTLMLDEADTIFNGSVERYEPLRAILNAGNRPGVTVPRCVGQAHELAEFKVYAPKALAGIDASKWPDTILDRSIRIEMRRAAKGERPEKFYRRFIEDEAEHLRDGLEAWAPTAIEQLLCARPPGLELLNDRAGEAWEPLFAIADMAAGDWPERARKAAGALSPEVDDDSIGILVLAALRRLFAGKEELATSEICEKLNADDELPFGGWRKGEGVDGRGLARLLRPFGVRPKTLYLGEGVRPKGYLAEDFGDAFERWL